MKVIRKEAYNFKEIHADENMVITTWVDSDNITNYSGSKLFVVPMSTDEERFKEISIEEHERLEKERDEAVEAEMKAREEAERTEAAE